jgi:hypothetical protein
VNGRIRRASGSVIGVPSASRGALSTGGSVSTRVIVAPPKWMTPVAASAPAASARTPSAIAMTSARRGRRLAGGAGAGAARGVKAGVGGHSTSAPSSSSSRIRSSLMASPPARRAAARARATSAT